jgi:hypothetical protein
VRAAWPIAAIIATTVALGHPPLARRRLELRARRFHPWRLHARHLHALRLTLDHAFFLTALARHLARRHGLATHFRGRRDHARLRLNDRRGNRFDAALFAALLTLFELRRAAALLEARLLRHRFPRSGFHRPLRRNDDQIGRAHV